MVKKKIQKKEKKILEDVFLIFKTTEPLGDLDVDLLEEELSKITTPNIRLHMLLDSPGGNIFSAYKMINMIRDRVSELVVIVPDYAKSAATLMALGGDTIVMSARSELGPLDMPMEHPITEGIRLSALDGVRPIEALANIAFDIAFKSGLVIRTKTGLSRKDSIEIALNFGNEYVRPIVSKLDPLVINMCERCLTIAERYGTEFLSKYMFKNDKSKQAQAEAMVHELVWGYPEHGYAISKDEAKRLGLNVTSHTKYPFWSQLSVVYKNIKKEERVIILGKLSDLPMNQKKAL